MQLDAAAEPPVLALAAELEDVTVTEPLGGLALDLGAGRIGGAVQLEAAGHGAAALAATLAGTARLLARDGVVMGIDLPAAAAAASAAGLPAAEIGLRAALAGGATAFERLEAAAAITAGEATIAGRLTADGGLAATLGGTVDLARGAIDLRFGLRAHPDGPEIGLRAAGPASAPRRLPEVARFLLWRAERG